MQDELIWNHEIIMQIMIHSLQSKLALQSIIWKNSLYKCSLEDQYQGFIWSKSSDLSRMIGWLKVMPGQLIFGHLIRYGKLSKLKLCFYSVEILMLKCSIFGHYFPLYQDLKNILWLSLYLKKNPGHLPPSLEGWVQQLASDDQSQFLVPHWRLP